MTTGVSTFDQSLNTTIEWLKDLREEMGYDDEQRAFRVMRAVLHALRDRLTIEDIKRTLPEPIRDLWP